MAEYAHHFCVTTYAYDYMPLCLIKSNRRPGQRVGLRMSSAKIYTYQTGLSRDCPIQKKSKYTTGVDTRRAGLYRVLCSLCTRASGVRVVWCVVDRAHASRVGRLCVCRQQ